MTYAGRLHDSVFYVNKVIFKHSLNVVMCHGKKVALAVMTEHVARSCVGVNFSHRQLPPLPVASQALAGQFPVVSCLQISLSCHHVQL